jgi:membrane-bound lytic murein transglycosylase D
VGRAVLAGWLGRMKRFENLIRAELKRHKLPQALLYVSMIESGFRPTTVSRAGAAGLWQFMAHGGSIYGLARSFWVDERFNPDRSTRAVMYYLKDLHQRFGNWELALAAYNAGYGSILRAVG